MVFCIQCLHVPTADSWVLGVNHVREKKRQAPTYPGNDAEDSEFREAGCSEAPTLERRQCHEEGQRELGEGQTDGHQKHSLLLPGAR